MGGGGLGLEKRVSAGGETAGADELGSAVPAQARVEAGELGVGGACDVAIAAIAGDGELAAEAGLIVESAEGTLPNLESRGQIGSRDHAFVSRRYASIWLATDSHTFLVIPECDP